MIAIMNPSSQQLEAVISSNRLKYLLQPNLKWAQKCLAAVFSGPDKVVVGLENTRSSFLKVYHLLIQWWQTYRQVGLIELRIHPAANAAGILLGFL